MSKVNGKQKGNNYERKIADRLSERFCDYIGVEKPFRRNPDSGSFFGGSNVERTEIYDTDFAVYGDLICPRNFRFVVECKHYKKAPVLDAILKQKIKDWDDWIAQCCQDSETSGKDMLLVVKYNYTEPLVITDIEFEKKPVARYKEYHVYTLEQVLTSPDNYFFVDENENNNI